jgi:TrmH family RNA methyltransferase
MEIISITSASNSLLKRMRLIQSRSGREKEGSFLIEGLKLFDEAVKHGVDIEDVVITESLLDSGFAEGQFKDVLDKVVVVEDKLMSGLATTETPQGLVASARFKRWATADLFAGTAPLVVVADRVQDPGNLGTMMRTALAFGATGLILTKGSVDAFNPKVVRSAAGALFALPFAENQSIEDAVSLCRERGLSILALSADGTSVLNEIDLKKPSALLLGNEANGLDEAVERDADKMVAIPMAEKSESLNVAIANAVVLYEASRQRRR